MAHNPNSPNLFQLLPVKSWHPKPPVYISTAGTATFFSETQSTPVAFVRAFECSTVAPKGCQPNLTTSLIVPHLGPIIFPNQATNAIGYRLARYYRCYIWLDSLIHWYDLFYYRLKLFLCLDKAGVQSVCLACFRGWQPPQNFRVGVGWYSLSMNGVVDCWCWWTPATKPSSKKIIEYDLRCWGVEQKSLLLPKTCSTWCFWGELVHKLRRTCTQASHSWLNALGTKSTLGLADRFLIAND